MEEQVPSPFLDLPAALTAQSLSHVPQTPRLTQCALVCRAWAAAATLSTVHVESSPQEKTVGALECWLQQHAGQLRTLRLQGGRSLGDTRLRLPLGQFKQLQRSELKYVVVQLPGEGFGASSSGQQLSDAAAGSVSNEDSGVSWVSLPSLQHLKLKGVVLESTTSLLQLTDAPQLTCLSISINTLADPNHKRESAEQQLAAAIAAMLAQLPRLSVLELPSMPFTDAAMQQLAPMQGLQQVSLSCEQHAAACGLQRLPNSITQLCLVNTAYGEPSLAPQLQQLTGLLHLQLRNCPLPPTLLGSVTQLQKLHLRYCTPLPSGGPEAAEALLAVLPKLICLQDLELQSLHWNVTGVAPQCFSALTASSHLTRLALWLYQPPSPLLLGAVGHMFPVHWQQPHLKYVQLKIAPHISAWCIDSTNLASIVSCCPALQHLDVTGTVQPGADVSVLLQLPDSCTSLAVGGAAFPDDAGATVVQLTQLKHLSWCGSGQLTDTGMQQLTALDLDSLRVACRLSPGLLSALDMARDPQKGSVSQQLAALCARSRVLAANRDSS